MTKHNWYQIGLAGCFTSMEEAQKAVKDLRLLIGLHKLPSGAILSVDEPKDSGVRASGWCSEPGCEESVGAESTTPPYHEFCRKHRKEVVPNAV